MDSRQSEGSLTNNKTLHHLIFSQALIREDLDVVDDPSLVGNLSTWEFAHLVYAGL